MFQFDDNEAKRACNVGWGAFWEEKKVITCNALQKFGSLGGWIAKIKTLDIELKMAPNFGG
jgi:hypothetical protein